MSCDNRLRQPTHNRTARHVSVNLMSLTRQSRLLGRLAAPLTLLLLAACAVGPNFKRPAAPEVSDYRAQPQSSTVATADTAISSDEKLTRIYELADEYERLREAMPSGRQRTQSMGQLATKILSLMPLDTQGHGLDSL